MVVIKHDGCNIMHGGDDGGCDNGYNNGGCNDNGKKV